MEPIFFGSFLYNSIGLMKLIEGLWVWSVFFEMSRIDLPYYSDPRLRPSSTRREISCTCSSVSSSRSRLCTSWAHICSWPACFYWPGLRLALGSCRAACSFAACSCHVAPRWFARPRSSTWLDWYWWSLAGWTTSWTISSSSFQPAATCSSSTLAASCQSQWFASHFSD